jgi:hypothetical protein|tara:strand:- start:3690 stop:4259 length:570 start_codon:yes stop_codon:yes gene_type:complete
MAAEILMISENKLKQSTAINMNVSVDLLLPYIRQSQKLYIEPRLGTELYEKIKTDISTSSLAGVYKTLVDDFIADVLVNYAFYHCVPFLRFRVENGNIYSKNSETGTALSSEEAQHFREEIRNTAEYYDKRLAEHLSNNQSSFPELTQNTGEEISPKSQVYYSGINTEMPPRQGTRITLQDFLTTGFDC